MGVERNALKVRVVHVEVAGWKRCGGAAVRQRQQAAVRLCQHASSASSAERKRLPAMLIGIDVVLVPSTENTSAVLTTPPGC